MYLSGSINRGKTKKEIAYQIVSDAPVVSIDEEVADRVKIFLDNNEVKDVSLVVLKILNVGNVEIKEGDYTEKISFSFENESIVNCRVLETEPKKLIEPTDLQTFIKVNGNRLEFPENLLLNPKDSITFSALVTGERGEIIPGARIPGGRLVEYRESSSSAVLPVYLLIFFMLSIVYVLLVINVHNIFIDTTAPVTNTLFIIAVAMALYGAFKSWMAFTR